MHCSASIKGQDGPANSVRWIDREDQAFAAPDLRLALVEPDIDSVRPAPLFGESRVVAIEPRQGREWYQHPPLQISARARQRGRSLRKAHGQRIRPTRQRVPG